MLKTPISAIIIIITFFSFKIHMIFTNLKSFVEVENSFFHLQTWKTVAPPWSNGDVMDHRSLPLGFESQHGHI